MSAWEGSAMQAAWEAERERKEQIRKRCRMHGEHYSMLAPCTCGRSRPKQPSLRIRYKPDDIDLPRFGFGGAGSR